MALVTITSKVALDAAIRSGPALVDFNAPWCAPCRLQEPILAQIGEQFEGRVLVASLNIDRHQDIAMELKIDSIPTLIFFRGGKEVNRLVGLQSEAALAETLKKLVNG